MCGFRACRFFNTLINFNIFLMCGYADLRYADEEVEYLSKNESLTMNILNMLVNLIV
jgi:hypothetical protein